MNRPLLRRRALFALFTGAAIATPLAARAQQPRPRRVGYLNLRAKGSFGHLGDYLRALQDTGFVEGRNLAIEYRYANGDYARMPVLAAELVRDNVEVISAFGSPASARAAMRATSTIPIVGLSVAPLVKHYNRPEGNVTGVRIITGDLTPKRLQILAEIVPGAAIGVLMNPTYPLRASCCGGCSLAQRSPREFRRSASSTSTARPRPRRGSGSRCRHCGCGRQTRSSNEIALHR
jgi:putative ABC transport system substrate-binding protein